MCTNKGEGETNIPTPMIFLKYNNNKCWEKYKGAWTPFFLLYFPLFFCQEKDSSIYRRWWWPMVVDGSPSFLWSKKSRRESLLYIGPTYTTTFVLLVRAPNSPSLKKTCIPKRVLFSAWKNISRISDIVDMCPTCETGPPLRPSVRPRVVGC